MGDPRFPDPLDEGPDVAAAQAEARARAAERQAREQPYAFEVPPGALGVLCMECGDTGIVDTGETVSPPTVRPCSHCEPGMYERWRLGHLSTAHDQAGTCQDPACKARHGRRRSV